MVAGLSAGIDTEEQIAVRWKVFVQANDHHVQPGISRHHTQVFDPERIMILVDVLGIGANCGSRVAEGWSDIHRE
jgi:hypothetical protein